MQHLTPTELSRELGISRGAVLERCLELGVPVYQGRIDRELFCAAVHSHDHAKPVGASETVEEEWDVVPAGRRAARAAF